eukprot:scaffold26472_cov162-Cylindrotheca_fusiformis.AAC.4
MAFVSPEKIKECMSVVGNINSNCIFEWVSGRAPRFSLSFGRSTLVESLASKVIHNNDICNHLLCRGGDRHFNGKDSRSRQLKWRKGTAG